MSTSPEPPVTGASLKLGVVPQPLDLARDEEAAVILAAATGAGTIDAGRSAVAEVRGGGGEVYGLVAGGELVAVYATRQDGMAVEVAYLAVAEGQRRKGYGRVCLQDALRRAGRRPLVAETDDAGLGFYTACGFKLVGKRRHPDGGVRYRLGWHAPTARPRAPLDAGAAALGDRR